MYYNKSKTRRKSEKIKDDTPSDIQLSRTKFEEYSLTLKYLQGKLIRLVNANAETEVLIDVTNQILEVLVVLHHEIGETKLPKRDVMPSPESGSVGELLVQFKMLRANFDQAVNENKMPLARELVYKMMLLVESIRSEIETNDQHLITDKSKKNLKPDSKFKVLLGTFIDNAFIWHTVNEYDNLKDAYIGFKKYVNSQLQYTDEELKKVWDTGRLDVELLQGNKLLNWVGIYARETTPLSEKEEKEVEETKSKKDSHPIKSDVIDYIINRLETHEYFGDDKVLGKVWERRFGLADLITDTTVIESAMHDNILNEVLTYSESELRELATNLELDLGEPSSDERNEFIDEVVKRNIEWNYDNDPIYWFTETYGALGAQDILIDVIDILDIGGLADVVIQFYIDEYGEDGEAFLKEAIDSKPLKDELTPFEAKHQYDEEVYHSRFYDVYKHINKAGDTVYYLTDGLDVVVDGKYFYNVNAAIRYMDDKIKLRKQDILDRA